MDNDNPQLDRFLESLSPIADGLVAGLDVADLADLFVTACVDLLSVVASGIMVSDRQGRLRVLASSGDGAQLLELLELQTDEGPCLEAFRTQQEVVVPVLSDAAVRWPTFVPAAQALGVVAASAVPLRLDGRTVGALNLFLDREGGLSRTELQTARLLACLVTVGILHDHTVREHERLAEQLQTALTSRITIEQAKGIIAARTGVGMAAAFNLLRTSARAAQRPIGDVAVDVTRGRLSPEALVSSARPAAGRGGL